MPSGGLAPPTPPVDPWLVNLKPATDGAGGAGGVSPLLVLAQRSVKPFAEPLVRLPARSRALKRNVAFVNLRFRVF